MDVLRHLLASAYRINKNNSLHTTILSRIRIMQKKGAQLFDRKIHLQQVSYSRRRLLQQHKHSSPLLLSPAMSKCFHLIRLSFLHNQQCCYGLNLLSTTPSLSTPAISVNPIYSSSRQQIRRDARTDMILTQIHVRQMTQFRARL